MRKHLAVEEVRLENLRYYAEVYGSQVKLLAVLAKTMPHISPSQLSQWIGRSTRGSRSKRRNISTPSARKIETALGLQRGGMDVPQWPGARDLPAVEVVPHKEAASSGVEIQTVDGKVWLSPEAIEVARAYQAMNERERVVWYRKILTAALPHMKNKPDEEMKSWGRTPQTLDVVKADK